MNTTGERGETNKKNRISNQSRLEADVVTCVHVSASGTTQAVGGEAVRDERDDDRQREEDGGRDDNGEGTCET